MSYRDPSPEDLKRPEFESIWQVIKRWDINVPDQYVGYCGATGNHVMAILDALESRLAEREGYDVNYYSNDEIEVSIELELFPRSYTLPEFFMGYARMPIVHVGQIEKLLGPSWEFKYLKWC